MSNIVFLDCTQAYLHQFSACNSKVELMVRGLAEQGNKCFIHNGVCGIPQIQSREQVQCPASCEVISYPIRIHKLLSWLPNTPALYRDLKCRKSLHEPNILILEAPDYHIYLLYIALGRWFGYRIAVISHEWGPSIKSHNRLRKPSVWLYAKTFGYFADAIMPISRYLTEKTAHFQRKVHKLPVLAEYTSQQQITYDNASQQEGYFLYCVYAAYTRVIGMLLDAFVLFRGAGNPQKLVLVLTGSEAQIAVVREYIREREVGDFVEIRTKLPYAELQQLYNRSIALLIPLDPQSEQDKARFSQKIAEYLSSARPLISTPVGEIPEYFHDGEDIILAKEYSPQGLANALQYAARNAEACNAIGAAGRELGKREFNHQIYGKLLHHFFESL